MFSTSRAVVCLIMAVALVGSGCASGGDPSDVAPDESPAPRFAATDLEGYWRCADDGSVTHITNVEMPGGGAGSFTPPGGPMVPDGRFRGIRFLGANQWEAMENERARPGFFGEGDHPLAWRRVVIEMESRHVFTVGTTVFRRQ
jgi:hypothetical protein